MRKINCSLTIVCASYFLPSHCLVGKGPTLNESILLGKGPPAQKESALNKIILLGKDSNEIFLQETAHLLFGSILLQEGAATDSIILVEKDTAPDSSILVGKGRPCILVFQWEMTARVIKYLALTKVFQQEMAASVFKYSGGKWPSRILVIWLQRASLDST